MNKTQHYQLNQWDPEDRILRVEFNADNAAIHTVGETAANGLAQEAEARSAADTSIRTDFAAADNTVRNEFAAADNAIRGELANEANTRYGQDAALQSAINNEANTRYAQDAAIRAEFAAADANVAAQNCMVKLYEVSTNYAATQVDVDVSWMGLQNYNQIIIIPKFVVNGNTSVMIRLNGISTSVYYNQNRNGNALCYLRSAWGSSSYGMAEVRMAFGGEAIMGYYFSVSHDSNIISSGCSISNTVLAPGAVTSLNFIAEASGTSTMPGSKITIYGVR